MRLQKLGLCPCPFWNFLLTVFLSAQIFLINAEIIIKDDSPLVVTANGVLRGKWQLSRNTEQHEERNFASFEGIPYAQPPKRFQPPEPPLKWTGTRNATETRSVCPQLEQINLIYHDQTEDCLFANVYVPIVNPVKVLPTMLWIHGGGFMDGAGSFLGPRYVMEQDVILVTLNYRLGALGFLNTGDRLIEGNMGLKDMIMALKWVQVNIGAFGGDPGNVTIFGESAGGAAVHTLMLSPAAKGLFQKVIAQSGSALCPWSVTANPKEVATNLAKELKCSTTNSTMMVQCLKEKSIREILEAQQKFPESFRPTIDADATDFSVLPDTPQNLVANPHKNSSAGVPLIIGFNQKEGLMNAAILMKSNPDRLQQLNDNWNSVLPKLLGYDALVTEPEKLERVSADIRDFYFHNISEITIKNLENLNNLYTDYFYFKEIKRTALLHAQYNREVYAYQFTYKGKFSVVNAVGIPSSGPTHADDLQYLFNSSLLGPVKNWPDLPKTSIDERFSVALIELWTSFAIRGKPEGFSQKWNPISPTDLKNSTNITTPLSWYNLQTNPGHVPETADLTSRLAFWETVFEKDDLHNSSAPSLISTSAFSRWIPVFLVLIITPLISSLVH